MSDPSVSERRIRPIQDAVAVANWKQALQLCEKWQKKGEKSDKFLALSAFVLLNQADKAQHRKGEAETLALCKRTPAVTDLDALEQLQDALESLSLQHEEGTRLWDRAVAANPTNKDLSMAWLIRSISEQNWLSAQKATMGLRKGFPKERQYEFWNILMCYLVNQDTTVTEKERQLFGNLAFRMMAKAVENVSVEKEQILTPGKAISTPEELNLMVKIYIAIGKGSEALAILNSTAVGLKSSVGEQDPQLHLSLLLEALEVLEDSSVAFDTCLNLLANSQNQVDDRIWNLLIKKSVALGSKKLLDQCEAVISSNPSTSSAFRSALLGKLNFFKNHNNTESSHQDTLLQVCSDYIKHFGNKAFCFDDLKDSLSKLDPNKIKPLIEAANSNPSNMTQLLALKLEYISLESSTNSTVLDSFVTKALGLLEQSFREANLLPEMVTLIAMTLLRISSQQKQRCYNLVMVILLEAARLKFEDYYPYSILLIPCYLNLGAISLAVDIFAKLSVKNLQWETVGHLLLTRISTLHPTPVESTEHAFEPLLGLDAGLGMLKSSSKALDRGIHEGLKNGNYVGIVDAVSTKSNLKRSVNGRISALEQRKINRLLGNVKVEAREDYLEDLADLRDFTFLPNYCRSDLDLQSGIRCGPLPKAKWINAMTFCQRVVSHLENELLPQAGRNTEAANPFKNVKSELESHRLSMDTELTPSEIKNLDCYETIANVIEMLGDLNESETEPLTDLFTRIQNHLNPVTDEEPRESNDSAMFGLPISLGAIRTPNWEYLHQSFSQLELLQTVSMLVAFLGKKTRNGKSKSALLVKVKIPELRKSLIEAEKAVHKRARQLKERINAPGVLTELVDISTGRREGELQVSGLEDTLGQLCDESDLETLCGRIRESWEDALDGILAIKVKSHV